MKLIDNIKPYCDGCKNKQSVYFAEIINGNVKQYYFCDSCPRLNEFYIGNLVDAQALLAGSSGNSAVPQHNSLPDFKCRQCGLTYEQFMIRGLLGCDACYSAFNEPLKVLLKHIHGSDIHVGKAPLVIRQAKISPGPAPARNRIDTILDMKEELKEAVGKEDFEQAVKLRNKIQDAESQQDALPPADQSMGEGI